MSKKTITEFFSNEYVDFALYTIENRAIPSVIDGFKTSQRKIIHVSSQIWKNGNEKTLKIFQLAGKVASDAYYHHGSCLDINTSILLSDNSFITIKEWITKYPNRNLEVVSYDEINKEYTTSIAHSPRIGKKTNKEIIILFDNNDLIRCTDNHPFLTQRGWVNAIDLSKSDKIVSLSNYSIKHININNLLYDEYFYDITVEKYHNFIINENLKLVTHNSSLENAIVTMAQKFKNNLPLLEQDGQFGSLRSTQAGAPRYIGARLSKNFKLIYKDFELLKFKIEEGETIEPEYFLPIIPTILLNGTSGIAVGFSSIILNRNINDILKSCINILNGKEIKELKPYSPEFNGDFIQDKENNKKWKIVGKFNRVNKTTIKITELPLSLTYEKYEEILDKLIENKDIISYDDNCKDNIDYTIKMSSSTLDKLSDDDIIKMFKLEESLTEIFTTLDENGKLLIFESTIDIVKYFVNFRLNFYQKRKEYLLSKMGKDLKILNNKIVFIKSILDNKLKINNRHKQDIIENLETLKLDKIDESYDYLLKLPIYTLTKEVYEKLKFDLDDKKHEIDKLTETDIKTMYLSDLSELKKNL